MFIDCINTFPEAETYPSFGIIVIFLSESGKSNKVTQIGTMLTLTNFLLIAAAVLYYYFYKRTAVHLGDPRFYQDSLWLRKEFAQVRC